MESIDVIKNTVRDYPDYSFYCSSSTGKDSVVTLDLVKQVIPDIKVVFNNTSCDVADVYEIVKKHKDWIILNPKEGIYNYFKRMNYVPARYSRGCCTKYKEGSSSEYFVQNNIIRLIQIMGSEMMRAIIGRTESI